MIASRGSQELSVVVLVVGLQEWGELEMTKSLNYGVHAVGKFCFFSENRE